MSALNRLSFILAKRVDTGVQYWKNPSLESLKGLVNKYHNLRGTANGNDVYFWNASDAVHETMEKDLFGHMSSKGFYVTREGHEADALEWQPAFYREGKGIRVYHDMLDPQHPEDLESLKEKASAVYKIVMRLK